MREALTEWLRRSSWLDKLRSVLLLAAIGAGVWHFGETVNAHYPISEWMFWLYARSWLGALLFGLSCLSAGHAALRWLLGRVLPVREQLTFSFAVGVLCFGLLSFVFGLLQWYRPWAFLAMPAILLAAGARPTARYLWRLQRHLRRARGARMRPAPGPWSQVLLGLGAICLLLIYLPVLSPDNVAYDARWYHLAIPEHYAIIGGIQRFAEGWYLGAYPHLASLLYVWAFLLPNQSTFAQVEQAAHIEVVIFLMTLVGIPALVRRLLPGTRSPLSWVVLFLFPEIFIYDSNLVCGADHVSALWVVPVFLAFREVWQRWSLRGGVLLAALTAGALWTKYTSLIAVAFPVMGYLALAAWMLLRGRRQGVSPGQVLRDVAAAGATGLLLTSPHWLKNWVFYGDPLYPTLHRHLSTLRPWAPDAWVTFENYFLTTWSRPPRTWDGLRQTFEALFTYSFIPNDWPAHHGKVPVFGSLFTLSLLCLPFLRRAGRLWPLFVSVHVGVFLWYWIHHFDRYLQTLLPLMAAGTAATVILLWREGLVHRLALATMLGAQIVWALDIPLVPSHVMIPGGSHYKNVIDLLSSTVKEHPIKRNKPFSPFPEIADSLPPGARPLLYEGHIHLGIRRASFSDWPGTQGGIHYHRYGSAREVHAFLKGLGVTHLLWRRHHSDGNDTPAADLMFFDLAERHTRILGAHGVYTVAELGPPPPAPTHGNDVAYFACHGGYKQGLYALKDLNIGPYDQRPREAYPAPLTPRASTPEEDKKLIDRASFMIINEGCGRAVAPELIEPFTLLTTHVGNSFYARTSEP